MDIDHSSPLLFQPIRNELYSSKELMSGFDPNDFRSMARIPDFQSYLYYVINGRGLPNKPYAGMMEAIHDNSILQAMYRFIKATGKPTAAIMGGHSEDRGTDNYKAVVALSKSLTENGFLMASGGGPGAMEATHLGASLAGESDETVAKALALLMTEKTLPNSKMIVDKDGNIDPKQLEQVHRWTKPAHDLMVQIENPGTSLAIPTWVYGHEPLTPLATQVAKYFQNSIREDVLLGMATNGIIYAPGTAGTFQEVFQDAAQNYYHEPDEQFSPMVFYGKDFWTNKFPVEPLIRKLFVENNRKEEYEANVRFLDDVEEIVEFLIGRNPTHEKSMQKFNVMGMTGKQPRETLATH